ncbi:MAG: hypothetical protein ABI862_21520 [Ilumatobacteraceae bacterium]
MTAQTTLPSARVSEDELVDHQAGDGVGSAERKPEVQAANSVGIDQGCRLERASAERNVDLIAVSFGGGLEPVLRHLLDQPFHRVWNTARPETPPTTGTTPDINRRVTRTDDFGQQQR